ncbi:zinc ABC transporter substrate-binding protein ZnuA [Orbaceae bacterium ac157xtp]
MSKTGFTKRIFLFLIISLFWINPSQAKIITSLKPLGFITQAIADGVTDTEILIPDGASPHNYALKPSDIVKLKSADLIIWIDEDMETFLPVILKGIDDNKQLKLADEQMISVLLHSNNEHEHAHEHGDHFHHGENDLHIWLSPEIAKASAKLIYDKLLILYPQKQQILTENLKNFENEVNQTKLSIAKMLSNVQNNGYFVFHDAFGYFESDFGLNKLGSFTVNPAMAPGLKKIYEIQTELKNKRAVCIFREPQFSPAIITKLVQGTDVKVGELDPLGMDINTTKDAYGRFLTNLAQQYLNCLQ